MVYGELAPGALFYFGKKEVRNYDYSLRREKTENLPIQWKKTAENGLSIGLNAVNNKRFDNKKPGTGSNRYEREHGYKVYFLSNLHKYLNCADESWAAVQEGDAYIEPSSGFLSVFSDEERKFIVPHRMETKIPEGYTKKYGSVWQKDVLVGLPSLSQIGSRAERGTLDIDPESVYTWVTDADTMQKFVARGYQYKRVCDRPTCACPLIKISDDAPVDVTSDGEFIIRIPEKEFTGDILSFLGISLAA